MRGVQPFASQQRSQFTMAACVRLAQNVALVLHGEPPALGQLARQLNLSERTLRRRIGEAGLSYSGIVDELRRTRALQLLGQRDNRLIDVACATGFSDVRNFRRAFKRWTGVTPRTAKQRIAQEP